MFFSSLLFNLLFILVCFYLLLLVVEVGCCWKKKYLC